MGLLFALIFMCIGMKLNLEPFQIMLLMSILIAGELASSK